MVKSCCNFLYGDSHGSFYLLDQRYLGENMKDIDFKEKLKDVSFSWYGDDPTNAINELKQEMAWQYTNFVA